MRLSYTLIDIIIHKFHHDASLERYFRAALDRPKMKCFKWNSGY